MDYAGMKRGNDDDATGYKRQKVAESKVLHVRGLPPFCTEEELRPLVEVFGEVVKCLIIPDKAQAFVQMGDKEQAALLLANLDFSQPSIRSKPIYFQYSSRQEVEIHPRTDTFGTGAGAGAGGGEGALSPTLIITVSNVTVPIQLDNIVQICKPYGQVMKVITFQKGANYQALVQLGSVEQAVQARTFLEGKDMFQGCCHLRVGFSKRHELTVKQNDHKSRDFTTDGGAMAMGGMGNNSTPFMGDASGGAGQYGMDPMGGMGGYQTPFGGGGAAAGMGNEYGMGDMGGMGGMAMGGMQQGYGGVTTPVVLVSGLPEAENSTVLAQDLYTLFGVYGDVHRIKQLWNKRTAAMVQMATPAQAGYVISYLSNTPFHGSFLKLQSSKYPEVKLSRPKPTVPGEEPEEILTHDFTASPHRHNGRMINQKNLHPPSQVLHLANLDEVGEQQLRDTFAPYQLSGPPVVEFFKTNRKMCFVGMDSVENAVGAMLKLNNVVLGKFPIRVSFSNKDFHAISNSDGLGGESGTPASYAQPTAYDPNNPTTGYEQ